MQRNVVLQALARLAASLIALLMLAAVPAFAADKANINIIGYSDEGIEIWFARGLEAGERSLDAGEFLDVFETTVAEIDDLARRGKITDAKTLIGLLWLANWRAGRWPLAWTAAPSPR